MVHVIPHSHCDAGYRKTFDQYFKENVNSTITTVLQALKVRWLNWGNLEHMGNLERPCKSSVNGKLQVKFSVCNVSVN